MRMLIHDIKNDIALIEGDFLPRFWVRYGLETKPYDNLEEAMTQFIGCEIHALTSLGLDYKIETLLNG